MNPQQLPGGIFQPQVAAGTAKSWVAKGDADRFSVRKLGWKHQQSLGVVQWGISPYMGYIDIDVWDIIDRI